MSQPRRARAHLRAGARRARARAAPTRARARAAPRALFARRAAAPRRRAGDAPTLFARRARAWCWPERPRAAPPRCGVRAAPRARAAAPRARSRRRAAVRMACRAFPCRCRWGVARRRMVDDGGRASPRTFWTATLVVRWSFVAPFHHPRAGRTCHGRTRAVFFSCWTSFSRCTRTAFAHACARRRRVCGMVVDLPHACVISSPRGAPPPRRAFAAALFAASRFSPPPRAPRSRAFRACFLMRATFPHAFPHAFRACSWALLVRFSCFSSFFSCPWFFFSFRALVLVQFYFCCCAHLRSFVARRTCTRWFDAAQFFSRLRHFARLYFAFCSHTFRVRRTAAFLFCTVCPLHVRVVSRTRTTPPRTTLMQRLRCRLHPAFSFSCTCRIFPVRVPRFPLHARDCYRRVWFCSCCPMPLLLLPCTLPVGCAAIPVLHFIFLFCAHIFCRYTYLPPTTISTTLFVRYRALHFSSRTPLFITFFLFLFTFWFSRFWFSRTTTAFFCTHLLHARTACTFLFTHRTCYVRPFVTHSMVVVRCSHFSIHAAFRTATTRTARRTAVICHGAAPFVWVRHGAVRAVRYRMRYRWSRSSVQMRWFVQIPPPRPTLSCLNKLLEETGEGHSSSFPPSCTRILCLRARCYYIYLINLFLP